jgi:hypothetical protein
VQQAVPIGNEDLWYGHQTLSFDSNFQAGVQHPAGTDGGLLPAAVDSIADDSSPRRSRRRLAATNGHERHC